MAKKKDTERRPTRKQLSRRALEERRLKQLYIGAAVFAVVLLAILGIGLYQELYRKPRRVLAQVNDEPIRADYYEKMLAYRRLNMQNAIYQLQQQMGSIDPNDQDQEFLAQYYQQQVQYYESQLEQLDQQVLEELVNNALIRQGAEDLGITVTEAELEEEIETQFGYQRNPVEPSPTPITATAQITGTPTPTVPPMTEAEFQQQYSEAVEGWGQSVGFTEEEFRSLFRINLFRTKLEEHLAEQVPTTALQIKARHILVETEEEAEQALARLDAGEEFETVAREMSTDESTRESGGDLGWFPVGQMVPEFEKVAFNTPPGEISDIVQTSFGYHIIKVEDKDEDHPLDDSLLAQRQQGVLEEWLQQQRLAAEITYADEFITPTPVPNELPTVEGELPPAPSPVGD
jgi:hypothetical protein